MIKMNNKFVLLISGVVCLCSCGTYRSYERPDMNVSESVLRLPAANDSCSTIASLSWKEMFRDPELQTLIEMGLINNADLNIARLKVKEAEARLMSSKLSFLPSVTLNPQGSISKAEGMSSSKNYSLATSAQWEIDVFGRQLSSKRGAAADVMQAEAYRQAVHTELVAMIANSYYTLLMLDRQAEIAQSTSDSWAESVNTMKGLMNAGEADMFDVRQTESNMYAVQASVVKIKQEINEVENSLSTLIGMPAQSIKRGSLDTQCFPDSLTAGIPLQLLANRPDVRSMEMKLASAFYATQTARSAFYPSVTLGGSAGWTNAASGKISNPGKWLLSAVGSIVQPLFNRGKNMANLKVAEARQEEALIGFEQCLLDAGKEVNDALVQWQSAGERIVLNEKQIIALRSALKSAELKMEYGSQNYLSVITARQNLLHAEMECVTDRFDKIQGVINLYHALGGGI